jgi:hypothetical protein
MIGFFSCALPTLAAHTTAVCLYQVRPRRDVTAKAVRVQSEKKERKKKERDFGGKDGKKILSFLVFFFTIILAA